MCSIPDIPDELANECDDLVEKLNVVIKKMRKHNEDIVVASINGLVTIYPRRRRQTRDSTLWF